MPDRYSVSNGVKSRTLERDKLIALSRQGKVPRNVFIRNEDGSEDWRQIATVDWLSTVPDDSLVRYCVECDSRLIATEQAFKKKMNCPACHKVTLAADYLDVTTDETPGSCVRLTPIPDFLAVAIAVCLCILALASSIAFFTDPALSMLLGFIMSAAGGAFFFFSVRHRSEAKTYRDHIEHVEDVLTQRSKVLEDRTRRLVGLEQSLVSHRDRINDDAAGRIEEAEANAYRRIRDAESNSKSAIDESRSKVELANSITTSMAQRYLDEQCKWWAQKLKSDNYHTQHERVERAIRFVQKQGFSVPKSMEKDIFKQLQERYELVVRKEAEKERQRQIREQIKAEQRAEREAREAERKAAEEQKLIQEALDEAMAQIADSHSADMAEQQEKIAELKRQLQEAEERGQRAVAQAQLTKIGHVYIISNIGSFGEGVYKIGLTRRLEPLDRVKELGDASVPFPFDVHAMIFSEDAPALENQLHKTLNAFRVNRVNMRKEFFRVELDTIIEVARHHHGEVEYLADAEALDYRQSLEMDDEEFTFLSQVAEAAGINSESDED